MPELNVDIPRLEVYVASEFLHGLDPAFEGKFEQGIAFAAASVPGQVLTFHVLLASGAVFGRLPIHALRRKPLPGLPAHCCQVWDCPSPFVTCTEYETLSGLQVGMSCEGERRAGRYLMTFDWYGDPVSEGAGDLGWKSGNLIEDLETGTLLCFPNNRLWPWRERAFVETGKSLPDYRIQPRTWSVEGISTWIPSTANG